MLSCISFRFVSFYSVSSYPPRSSSHITSHHTRSFVRLVAVGEEPNDRVSGVGGWRDQIKGDRWVGIVSDGIVCNGMRWVK